MTISVVDQTSFNDFSNLTKKFWNEVEDLDEKIFLDCKKYINFIAYNENLPVGIICISFRVDYVAGSTSSSVAYIEALYVDEDFRKKGIADQLINRATTYLKSINIYEIGSDCTIDNIASYKLHLKHGFSEVERIVSFIKKIK